jgi:SOS-response transcriptional repressor LexA
MLTHRQHQLVSFIAEETQRRGGVCPSYAEMAAVMKVPPGRVHDMLCRCEERGAVKRIPNRARAVEVIRLKPREKWFRFDAEEKVLKPFHAKGQLR